MFIQIIMQSHLHICTKSAHLICVQLNCEIVQYLFFPSHFEYLIFMFLFLTHRGQQYTFQNYSNSFTISLYIVWLHKSKDVSHHQVFNRMIGAIKSYRTDTARIWMKRFTRRNNQICRFGKWSKRRLYIW